MAKRWERSNRGPWDNTKTWWWHDEDMTVTWLWPCLLTHRKLLPTVGHHPCHLQRHQGVGRRHIYRVRRGRGRSTERERVENVECYFNLQTNDSDDMDTVSYYCNDYQHILLGFQTQFWVLMNQSCLCISQVSVLSSTYSTYYLPLIVLAGPP